jgi:hypothetical protein
MFISWHNIKMQQPRAEMLDQSDGLLPAADLER